MFLALSFIFIREYVLSDLLIVEEPIDVPTIKSHLVLKEMDPEKWRLTVAKFRHEQPFTVLADLLHHLGNGIPFREGDHSVKSPREILLEDFLDGNLTEVYQPKTPWLFRGVDGRPHVVQGSEPAAEAHPSQLLAEFASYGVPTSRTIQCGSTSSYVSDLIRSLRDDFHLEGEIEWKAIAMARYAPSPRSWSNRWGKSFNFDMIVNKLLQRPTLTGSCRGTHALQALAIIRRVDLSTPILTQSSRAAIIDHLRLTIKQLQSSQRPTGYWAPDWPSSHPNTNDYSRDALLFTEGDLALVTGHHLEWLDLLDEELYLPHHVYQKAVLWCSQLLERTSDKTIYSDFCSYSHCFRAVRRNVSAETLLSEMGDNR